MRFYESRRQALADQLPKGAVVVVMASEEALRNGDVFYDFRQDSDFFYLTGIEEPGFALVIEQANKKSTLFVPDISLHHHIWMGHQLSPDQARRKYRTDAALPMSMIREFVRSRCQGKKVFSLPRFSARLSRLISPKKADTSQLRKLLDELRVHKEKAEISWMLTANAITRDGHIAAMQSARPGLFEFQVQASMEKVFRLSGARHNAYSSIVATGPNAAILHYHKNTARLKSGDMLLIDAGAECNAYAADVSRTFPVSGFFSKLQKSLYEEVLLIQKKCIALCRPGIAMSAIHQYACELTIEALIRLGILKNLPVAMHFKDESYRLFFPHGIGHLLGLDVHDVGEPSRKLKNGKSLRTRRPLETGFAVTIEPGIYFIDAHFKNADTRKKFAHLVDWNVAARFKSIGGIRIEDDILITKSGRTNLTTTPKEIREIEKIMNVRGRR